MHVFFSRKSNQNVIDVWSYRNIFLNSFQDEKKFPNKIMYFVLNCQKLSVTKYPEANEGFLTQMKSKIVNRKNLNKLGDELQLVSLIQNQSNTLSENISGNLFEAFIGAIYLDFGYDICKKVVLEKIFTPDQINKLEKKIVSYKSLLLEWSQKKKVGIRYETNEEHQPSKNIVFRAYVWIDGEKVANATETSKKKAEEKAAQRAFYMLNKKESIIENVKINS